MKVSRKQFLQTVAAAPMQSTPQAAPQTRKPNVLILMSDQHRPDLMTCAGQDLVPTPHLDRNYTVFGQVTSGMEHVDRIKQGDRMKTVEITER